MSWILKPMVYQLLKTDKYGEPYTAVATVTRTEPDTVYVSGLVATERFSPSDYRAIRKLLGDEGFANVKYIRIN